MNPAADTLAPTTSPMELHSRAERILVTGLGLGIAGDYLLRDGPVGPGLCAWLALLTAAALCLTRVAGAERRRTLLRWSATALAAAMVTVVRGLDVLIPAMFAVILASAVLTALETGGTALRTARVRDYFFTGFTFPLQMLTHTPRMLKQADLSAVTQDKRLPGFMRGFVIAVPVLLVFGMLFASADAAFAHYAEELAESISPELLQHMLLVLVFAWAGTSLLGIGCRRASATGGNLEPTAPFSLGTVEAHVVLALVSALFIVFVLLQLGYLFGGAGMIVSTSGLTVAEYARRGFFELLVVATLTLGLLLAFDATDCERRILRRYGTVLIVCVLIILASALQRLFLYTDTFGMSLGRVSALVMMLWQAFNLVSFAFTVLHGNVRGFVSGLVISGVASLLLLGLVNPAAIVARINLERAVENSRPLDVAYLAQLGADAVPPVLASFSALPAKQQCEAARYLLLAYPIARDAAFAGESRHWRHWNAAQAKAERIVRERADELSAVADLPSVTGPFPLGPVVRPC
jgi:hypothetical protein